MRISPPLLLLMMVLLVFAPAIQEWGTQGGIAWYRPYQLWLVVIIFVWWTVRRALQRENQLNQSQTDLKDNR